MVSGKNEWNSKSLVTRHSQHLLQTFVATSPLWSYSHNATDCHSQANCFEVLHFWPICCWLFWPAAAAVALSRTLSLPPLSASLPPAAVRFLFRLVASPLAYQKVTYLTRHKWKSKRLISSSFSSTVCLCLSVTLTPPAPLKSWRKSAATYQLTGRKETKKRKPPFFNLKICWQSAFSRVGCGAGL